nr:MAG TPA: hypothetical protein [Caudoviricetes sp.]
MFNNFIQSSFVRNLLLLSLQIFIKKSDNDSSE